jgi:hypothetical protein
MSRFTRTAPRPRPVPELGRICVGYPHSLELWPADELVGDIIKAMIRGHVDKTRCVEIVIVSGDHPHTEDCGCFDPPERES